MPPLLPPETIQDIVTTAFILEPLAEKPGCTTRTHDLPGKPLSDFLIAGINAAKYFRFLARDLENGTHTQIFAQYPAALQGSNLRKSPKTINFGLLEIMFPAVYARLHGAGREQVVDEMIASMQKISPADVAHLLHAREIAWLTSTNERKKQFDPDRYRSAQSPWTFYQLLHADTEPSQSSYQWAQEYFDGLPMIRALLDAFAQNPDALLEVTAQMHVQRLHVQPDCKVGMIADMCAAAFFCI